MQITIVIPTHNRPAELKRSLASVNVQCSSLSSECLVIDNSDPEYKKEVKNIAMHGGARYIETNTTLGNGGCGARNTGISEASGDYIAFLDDDDAWTNDKLRMQFDYLQQERLTMGYTGLHIISNNGHKRYSFRTPRTNDFHKEIMKKNFIGTTSSILVQRTLINTVNGFDPALPALQDYDLYIRLLRTARLGWLPEPLTLYYANDPGTKVSGDRQKYIAAVKYLSIKYRNDPHYQLLKKSFAGITLLKCIRSRRFLLDTIRDLVGRVSK